MGRRSPEREKGEKIMQVYLAGVQLETPCVFVYKTQLSEPMKTRLNYK